MSELEPPPPRSSNAGVRVLALGICAFALIPVLWPVFHWLVSWFVPRDKVGAFTDAVDLVGATAVLVGLVLGLNYVTWKYVESRWLRWLVFGLEGLLAAGIAYGLLFAPGGNPP